MNGIFITAAALLTFSFIVFLYDVPDVDVGVTTGCSVIFTHACDAVSLLCYYRSTFAFVITAVGFVWYLYRM
jgi:hypothetical protein